MEFTATITVKESGRNSPVYLLESDLDGTRSLEDLLKFLKQSLIEISKNALNEEQAKGFPVNPKDYVTTVDGNKAKPIDQVKPFGQIYFTKKTTGLAIILEVYESILAKSPVDSGTYKESNFVFLNTQRVATDIYSLKTWLLSEPKLKSGDQIFFINVIPYARKLERFGVTAGGAKTRFLKSKDRKQRTGAQIGKNNYKSILGANGTYFLTAKSVQRKYKNNSKIKFGFISGDGIGLTILGASTKSGKSLRTTYKKTGRSYLYPYIRITIDEAGLSE